MIVAALTLELMVYESRSLKEKRRVIQSVKSVIRNRFQVSVAEVDHEDSHKRCTLGVALVANDSRFVHEQLDKVVDLVRSKGNVTLLSYERELF